jgi:hypothetical protein
MCEINSVNKPSILLEDVLKELGLTLKLLHSKGLPFIDVRELLSRCFNVTLPLP